MSLRGKVAIISGSTRGIGSAIAKRLAKNECQVIITGKSENENKKLPGTIYSVANEINESGGIAEGIYLNLLEEKSISELVDKVISNYGKIDILINNASALYWNYIENTPIKKYDLINKVNTRGTYLLSQACIPHMPPGSSIITQSLPINSVFMDKYIKSEALNGKTAYLLSKIGMSLVASGLAIELKDKKISSNCIWPLKPINSFALTHNDHFPDFLKELKNMRKNDIIVDCVEKIINEPCEFTNNFLVDEHYLMSKGITDFSIYQSVDGHEPPLLMTI